MTAHACSSPAPLPDWRQIDTVCLDMDGTVLDHRFDNRLWLEELPRRWGERHGIEHGQAVELLKRRFDSARGTLEYYCVDHWSEQLDFDIPALKHELRDEIRYLDGADEFLDLLRASGKRVLLTTNAHPISLAVKNQYSRLARHFDELVSSHTLGVPKEHAGFWPALERTHAVDVRRTLFADDSAVVLEAALAAGVAWIYQVLRPDSTRPPHPAVAGIPGVMRLADLGGSLRAQLSGVEAPESAAPGDAPSA
jgi:haloacid dehalogenase superfamily, subfamily IA, variant 3 with third motif having DD or ED